MLGNVAAKVDSWIAQRDDIAAELNGLIGRAQSMLTQLDPSGQATAAKRRGRPPAAAAASPADTVKRGRKRRTMSAEARRKISEAQKKRWAAQKKAAK